MKNIFFLLWFKLIRYLERCVHLHISTGNVPIASVLPRTPQRQVVPQVEPQVIRHGPEDVRHHPGIIFVLFDVLKRTWYRLLSLQTGRGSRLSRVPFESSNSPLRPFIFHIFYIFLTKFPHTWTLTCLLKSLAIFLSILKNSANAFLKLLVILLFQNL